MTIPCRTLLVAATVLLVGALAVLPAPSIRAHSTLDSGPIEPGGNWSMTFYMPRDFVYHCHPHPWMEGTVRILPAAEDQEQVQHVVRIVEPGSDPTTWRYEPAFLEIHAWDSVLWVNEGDVMHTVSEADDHGVAANEPAESPAAPILALLAIVAGVAAVAGRARQR